MKWKNEWIQPTLATSTVRKDEDQDGYVAYTTPAGRMIIQCTPVQTVLDGNGMEHTLVRFPVVIEGSKKKSKKQKYNHVLFVDVIYYVLRAMQGTVLLYDEK